jgi:hypothetical protein
MVGKAALLLPRLANLLAIAAKGAITAIVGTGYVDRRVFAGR